MRNSARKIVNIVDRVNIGARPVLVGDAGRLPRAIITGDGLSLKRGNGNFRGGTARGQQSFERRGRETRAERAGRPAPNARGGPRRTRGWGGAAMAMAKNTGFVVDVRLEAMAKLVHCHN